MEVGIVEAVAVVVIRGGSHVLLARKSVHVRAGVGAAQCDRVPKWVVLVAGRQSLAGIGQISDVASPVGVIVTVRVPSPRSGHVIVAPGQKSANPARSFKCPTEVASPCVAHRRRVGAAPLLDYPPPVIDIMHFPARAPDPVGPPGVLPEIIHPHTQPPAPVIGKVAPLPAQRVRRYPRRVGQLILRVIGIPGDAAGRQVPVAVVGATATGAAD